MSAHDLAEISSVGTLASYTEPGLILPELRARNATAAVRELASLLGRAGKTPELAAFTQAALDREKLTSTAMEHGLAFPHGRIAGLERVWFAAGKTPEPIPWDPAGQGVSLVFLLAVPALETMGYLNVISGLARVGKDTALLSALRAATSAEAMFEIFKLIQLRSSSKTAK